jgi:hypothetical protein
MPWYVINTALGELITLSLVSAQPTQLGSSQADLAYNICLDFKPPLVSINQYARYSTCPDARASLVLKTLRDLKSPALVLNFSVLEKVRLNGA